MLVSPIRNNNRTYLRIALSTCILTLSGAKNICIPIKHRNLYFFRPPFDVEKVVPACHMLEGEHDFASFGLLSTPPKPTVRFMQKVIC